MTKGDMFGCFFDSLKIEIASNCMQANMDSIQMGFEAAIKQSYQHIFLHDKDIEIYFSGQTIQEQLEIVFSNTKNLSLTNL